MKVIIALGSNLGNRSENIAKAQELFERYAGKILKRTPVIETPPFGVTAQSPFLNCGFLAETFHPPFELLSVLKWMERRIGRFKTFRWGPRVIDMDILAIEKVKIDTPLLRVPHPGLKERWFFRFICLSLLEDEPYRDLFHLEFLSQPVF